MARLTAQVPKDLNQVEPKLFFGLTKRQLIWNGIGIIVGFSVYFALKSFLSVTAGMVALMISGFPFFLVSIFQKDGLTAEEIAKHFFISQYRNNPIRIYRKEYQLNDLIQEHQAAVAAKRAKSIKNKSRKLRLSKQNGNKAKKIIKGKSLPPKSGGKLRGN